MNYAKVAVTVDSSITGITILAELRAPGLSSVGKASALGPVGNGGWINCDVSRWVASRMVMKPVFG